MMHLFMAHGVDPLVGEAVNSVQTSKGEKKRDMRKVKCFACHKPGQYTSGCPNKKKDKKKSQTTALADIDKFSSIFDEDFSLNACLSSSST
jgi:hypothetical protein